MVPSEKVARYQKNESERGDKVGSGSGGVGGEDKWQVEENRRSIQ